MNSRCFFCHSNPTPTAVQVNDIVSSGLFREAVVKQVQPLIISRLNEFKIQMKTYFDDLLLDREGCSRLLPGPGARKAPLLDACPQLHPSERMQASQHAVVQLATLPPATLSSNSMPLNLRSVAEVDSLAVDLKLDAVERFEKPASVVLQSKQMHSRPIETSRGNSERLQNNVDCKGDLLFIERQYYIYDS